MLQRLSSLDFLKSRAFEVGLALQMGGSFLQVKTLPENVEKIGVVAGVVLQGVGIVFSFFSTNQSSKSLSVLATGFVLAEIGATRGIDIFIRTGIGFGLTGLGFLFQWPDQVE